MRHLLNHPSCCGNTALCEDVASVCMHRSVGGIEPSGVINCGVSGSLSPSMGYTKEVCYCLIANRLGPLAPLVEGSCFVIQRCWVQYLKVT